MATIMPTKVQDVDTRDGNHYRIFTVVHTTGTASDIAVPDTAASACELPVDITVSAGLAKETSTSAGVTIRNLTTGASGFGFDWATGDGQKQVTIASGAASGTYIIVVRMIGSPAGLGGTKGTGL